MKKRFLDIVAYLIAMILMVAFIIVSSPWVIYWAIHNDKKCLDALDDTYEVIKAKLGD